MLQETTDSLLETQLLRIARDPDLRLKVYDHLREYCHQCRNRLNSLKLSIYLAMKQSASSSTADPWVEIERHYRDLERRVEQVQFLCRPIVLSRVTLGLDLLIEDRRETWSVWMAGEGRVLELVPPKDRAVVSFDVDCLGRALDSIVSWRATRAAARSAKLRWWVEDGIARVSWEEPPIDSRRGIVSVAREAPAWSLPTLARVALAHGGDYRIESNRGWRLEVSWPSQPPTP